MQRAPAYSKALAITSVLHVIHTSKYDFLVTKVNPQGDQVGHANKYDFPLTKIDPLKEVKKLAGRV